MGQVHRLQQHPGFRESDAVALDGGEATMKRY